MSKKKVLFITTRLIYPTNSGRKVVLYNYCKGLSEIHDCDVYLFSFLEVGETRKINQPDFIKKVFYAKQPEKVEKIKNLIKKTFIERNWPLQISLYYSKSTYNQLIKVIKDIEPDVLICDMARTAEYIRNINVPNAKKILDMDDLISKRYERQINSSSLDITTFGFYAKKLPLFIQKVFNFKYIVKSVLKFESKILSNYEKQLVRDFDSVIFVSPLEAEEYNELTNSNKAIDITIGVDYEYYSKQVAEKTIKNLIGFLGNMYVSHNKDAVNYFLKEIFPAIKKEIPNAKFRIVGKCSEGYKKQFDAYECIEVTGEVDDIRKYIQECEIVVAPLTYGSGIKTKILETMAMGIPVITNDIGIEGIKVTDNQLVVALNSEQFVNNIVNLLNNKSKLEYMSQNSLLFIDNNYRWENILLKFNKII
ncbi:glycosyltransferase [Clostridium tetanomorphum]|uniref:Glycosyltransferase n=1 Tax=Clostridium tetanomorphum TaxID=1553 RepID=A0A923E5Z5_CLOTT|nr:glycosyltransferase [Clostridium tetanomorphum]MBC2397112.1 glycosyltransferase [Clostridium tetanomorphum]NRZ99044.1 glycosyltransferase involved in cell wall biosynthesis [Clostridium tetanomorphum]